MSKKEVNKITISISSNLDIKYSCIKTHSYILEHFKKSARYHYNDKNFITLYPYKIYETEDEFFMVSNDIYSIIRSCNDTTIFTYNYNNINDKNQFSLVKNENPKFIFLPDSDEEVMTKG